MKEKYLTIILLASVGLASCDQLGSVDRIEPENVLVSENLFSDAETTEGFMNGIYRQWRGEGITKMRNAMFQMSRTTLNTNVSRAYEFKANNVSPMSPLVEDYYRELYRLINQANTILAGLPSANPEGILTERKNEILGEAYFNRGLAYLMLLRSFGEFWDVNSPYGVVLCIEPMNENLALSRSSVKECYALIESDFQQAAKLVPEEVVPYRANVLAAKAYLAKTALYQKKYDEAVKYANEVISEGESCGVVLEQEYSDVFNYGYESTELLFSAYTSYPEETIETGIFNDFYFNGVDGSSVSIISDELVGAPEDGDCFTGENMDPRFSKIFWYNEDGELRMSKYPNNIDGEDVNPYYLLRLAEVYLVKAEALARSNDFAGAREAFQPITKRVGYEEEYLDGIADGDLLMCIFRHKFIELCAENYEEWYDMVRYKNLDNIDFESMEYTRSFRHSNLPIPYAALSGNVNLVQNPDYVH